LQQVQRLIEGVDFDGSGQLDFVEFTKLMRQLFFEEAQHRRHVFKMLDVAHDGSMPIQKLGQAMTMITGTVPDADMLYIALEHSIGVFAQEMTLSHFDRFFAAYRKLLMDSVLEHAGFVPSEVEMLRDVFDSYDEEDEGVLNAAAMRRLVAELIPEANDPVGRSKVLAIIEEFTPAGKAGLDFRGFLHLMRACHDLRDEQDIVRESEIVTRCEFSPEEVEGLRQLFSSNINCFGEVTLENLTKVFQRITQVTEREERELALLLREANPQHRECVRFPDFLNLMRTVIQQNVLGVNDASSRVLRRAESQKNQKE
jgi:Ca2+-binding EF-hand superfamily protein